MGTSRYFSQLLALGYGLRAGRYQVWDFSGNAAPVSGIASDSTKAPVATLSLATSGTGHSFQQANVLVDESRTSMRLNGSGHLVGTTNEAGGTYNPFLDLLSDQRWTVHITFKLSSAIITGWSVGGYRWLVTKMVSATQKGFELLMYRDADTGGRPSFRVYAYLRGSSTSYLIVGSEKIVVQSGSESATWCVTASHVPAESNEVESSRWTNVRPLTGLFLNVNGLHYQATGANGGVASGPVSCTTSIDANLIVGADRAGSNRFNGTIGSLAIYANCGSVPTRAALLTLDNQARRSNPDFMDGAPSAWLGGSRIPKRTCVGICTDLAEDPGDPLGLWQGLSLHAQGIIEILWIENCIGVANSTGIARAILQEAKQLGIPIFHSKVDTTGLPTSSAYIGVNAAPYNTGPTLDSAYEDSKTGIHRIMKAHDTATKGKVVITTWGYVRGLMAWLNYDDGTTGQSLFIQKVAGVLSIFGGFDPCDGFDRATSYSASSGYFMWNQKTRTRASQGTIPSEFGQNTIEWNVQHDPAEYGNLATFLQTTVPANNSGFYIPWVIHHIRPSVLLTDVNVNELDRGNTAYIGAVDHFNPSGAMAKILTDFAASGGSAADVTARTMGRPAWEQGALLHLWRGLAGTTDTFGALANQIFEWQQTNAKLWIQTSATPTALTLGTMGDGGTATSAANAQGWTVAGPTDVFSTNDGPVHIVGREPFTGFSHASEYTSLIDRDLKWLTDYVSGRFGTSSANARSWRAAR